MADRIIMPKQGLQMTEGTITRWLVPEGGAVREGEPLFEMETDKLTITIDAAVSGTLLKIVAPEGETVPITELIAVVGQPGEDIASLLANNEPAAPAAAAVASAPARTPSPPPTGTQPAGGRKLITPRAKTRAAELDLDWQQLSGSGPDGLVVERDVQAAADRAPAVTPLARKVAGLQNVDLTGVQGSGPRGKITRADVEGAAGSHSARIPLTGMRGTIARRMRQSLEQNAQAVHRVSVRMDEAARVCRAWKDRDVKVGYNDLIALATVRALTRYPAVNAEVVGEEIWQKDFVNLGIAVAVEGGLLVPVVKDAHRLSLPELAASIRELGEQTRTGRLSPASCEGGTFTLSNLGMFGLEEFVAIINPPESGILAVGKIEDTPVVLDGVVTIRPVMKLTLSYDHRVVDGAPAAQFLAAVKEYLENPMLML